MKKLAEYIVSSIVDYPKQIKLSITKPINAAEPEQILLSVAPEDMGKVIGKKGIIIRAIRNLLRVKTIITGNKAILILKEE